LDVYPLSVHLWSRKLELIYCNEQSAILLNAKDKKELLDRISDFTPEYQPDGQNTEVKRVNCLIKTFNEGKLVSEWVFQTREGIQIPTEITFVRIPYDKDFAVIAFIRDLREQKKMLEEIKTASDKFRLENSTLNTMFDLAPDLIFCKDLDLNYTRCNKSFFQFFDLSMEDVMGKNDSDGLKLPPKIVDEFKIRDHQVITECGMHKFEEHVPDIDGKMRIFETYKIPLQQDGDLRGIMGIARDITERKEMEEAAFNANRAKTAFLANMSHEIRTPMNAILGIAEIQKQEEGIQDSTREALEMIYNSGELLLSIINDLLDMSKIDAGKFELVPVKYEVASLINDTMMLNMTRLGSKPIEFMLHADENIPMTLYGDELRIKQILNNLLSNAFKYTKKGAITLSAYAEEAAPGSNPDEVTLVFKLNDTGIGMTNEQINALFDEYSRFNMEANRTTQGTGLGMSITRNLLTMMRGEIVVKSTVDVGSEFTIRIPQKKLNDAVLGKELAENLQMFRVHSVKQIKNSQVVVEPMPYGKILIVDDVESNLYVARGLMKPYELNVDTVTSGFDAIKKIKDGTVYDVVFMDHMMPNMDGLEATKIIRELGYSHPIIALTANAVVGQADVFLASGFDGFVSKPIDMRELNNVLRVFVRDKQPLEVLEAMFLAKGSKGATPESIDAKSKEVKSQEAISQEAIDSKSKEAVDSKSKEAVDMMGNTQKLTVDQELIELFLRDVSKALSILQAILDKQGAYAEEDIRSYTITTHGLKSSLANIGESELSAEALSLEQAGRSHDVAMISNETQAFMDKMAKLVKNLEPLEEREISDTTEEELSYMQEKLCVVQDACLTYDKKSAKDIIVELRQKKWPGLTNERLKMIAEYLLHGYFEKASDVAGDIIRAFDKSA
jgi:PAS domain S-box-containing protein